MRVKGSGRGQRNASRPSFTVTYYGQPSGNVRFTPVSDRTADIAVGPVRANCGPHPVLTENQHPPRGTGKSNIL
jgi:hypothetical protein